MRTSIAPNIMKCNLCSGESYRRFLPAYVRSVGVAEELSLVQCCMCGLVFLDPQPSWDNLKRFYPESYYQEDTGSTDFASRLNRVLRTGKRGEVTIPGGKLLDVGCGNGDFLLEMRRRGMKVFGVEPGRYGFQICKSRGLEVQNTFLETAGYQDGSFDVITLNHVLEHVPDPRGTLSRVMRLLSPSGVVVIQVPNLNSFAFFISRQYFFHLDVPRHLFHFTRATLVSYLVSAGLAPIKVKYYTSVTAILESLWLKLRRPASTYDKAVAQRNRLAMVVLELALAPFGTVLSLLHLGDSVEVYAGVSEEK